MNFFALFFSVTYILSLLFGSALYAEQVVPVKIDSVTLNSAAKKELVDDAVIIDEKDEQALIKEEIAEPKVYRKVPLLYASEDSEYKFAFKFRPEFFYGNHLRLLHIPGNRIDEILYFRHTIDFVGEYHYGKASHGHDVAMFKVDVRNRGVWGDAEYIMLTTESPVGRLDVVTGNHRHGIARHLLWIRELWLQMTLNDMFSFPWCNQHTLTIGSFPFEVGRGIALGSAYGVGPDLLGYYAEAAIDQYAFGAKFSGDWVRDLVGYDVYAEIVDNKSGSFEHVTARVRGQEYGRLYRGFREFGIINYIIAGKLRLTPKFQAFSCPGSVYVEPYVVFNDQREQKLEFIGDSTAKLVTPGISGEFTFGNFECGFDTAFNLGSQKVKGYDRNTIIEQNRDGYEVIINSKVNQISPDGSVNNALKVDANQRIINASRINESEAQNGQVIGLNTLGTLVNAADRFRDPYEVKFRGSMAVFDMGYYICRPDLKVNFTFGFASGDENPHKTIDPDEELDDVYTYEGFISLQEVYAGNRVKSAFLLSGPGRVPRVLSFPAADLTNPFPSTVSRFTNLVFTGGSLEARLGSCREWRLNPNILSYWQERSTRVFDRDEDGNHIEKCADSHLGIEYNLFAETELTQDLRFFFVGSLFDPGKHFKHIENRPMNRDQHRYQEAVRKMPDNKDIERVPHLKVEKAYFVNFGLEYKF